MKYPNPKEICFHSWRQFFCSRMFDVIPDKRVVMALSGHKTTAMLDHYGKHLEQEKTLAIAKEVIKEVFKDETTNEPDEFKNFRMEAKVSIRILSSWEFYLFFLNWKKVERGDRFLRIRELPSWILEN